MLAGIPPRIVRVYINLKPERSRPRGSPYIILRFYRHILRYSVINALDKGYNRAYMRTLFRIYYPALFLRRNIYAQYIKKNAANNAYKNKCRAFSHKIHFPL
jgi:hypothetical protein